MKKKDIIAMIAILAAGGCASNDEMQQQKDPVPIRLTASVSVEAKTRSVDSQGKEHVVMQTPATRGVQETAIASGEKVYVWGQEAGSSSWTYLQAWDLTSDGSNNLSGTTKYYPLDGSTLTMAAVHGNFAETLTEGSTAIGTLTHSVEADQETAGNYEKSDLLWGTASGGDGDATKNIPFVHKLTKIEVNLSPAAGYTASDMSTAEVHLHNVLPDVGIDVSNGNLVAASGSATTITPRKNTSTGTYEAIIPSQTFANPDALIAITTTKGGLTLTSTVPNTVATFAENTKYVYNVTVKEKVELSTLTISSIGSYTYDGTAKTPEPTITDPSSGKTLIKDVDYSLSYANNINAGTATVTITGMGFYFGTQDIDFTINPIVLTGSELYFASATKSIDYIWELNSDVTNELTKPTDCTVEYSSDDPSIAAVDNTGALTIDGTVGSTTITATATGNYSGTATYTMTVVAADNKVFSYTGDMQSITLPAGTYQLEVWGGRGGYSQSTYHGGYGGYAKGNKTLTSSTTLYVCVGGAGSPIASLSLSQNPGGYNGGGNGGGSNQDYRGAAGGGATHIATETGTLYTLLNGTAAQKSSVMIVAGGGGGAGYHQNGGNGGGATGSGTSGGSGGIPNMSATTSSNYYALGQGQAGYTKTYYGNRGTVGTGGGGGGYYGGKAYQGAGDYSDVGGAGGTGYVGGVDNGTQSNGAQNGYGQAKITWISN
ncbi:MAG: fimbrillin family protein [Prevotella sp.]|nr:fimbrillin family protein [Prevotella sp.]